MKLLLPVLLLVAASAASNDVDQDGMRTRSQNQELSNNMKLSDSLEKRCSEPCIGGDTTNNCYTLVTTKKTWMAAKDHCSSSGMMLAEVKSQAEHDVVAQLGKTAGGYLWLGGSNMRLETKWEWVTSNEAIPMTGQSGFSKWYPGEPSRTNGGEHCLEMYHDTYHREEWNDQDCGDRRAFVCQKTC